MGKRDKRVDAYIAKSAEFARPILLYLRELVHTGCPEVVETIKWGMPSFEYKGMLCGMAAFKAHATFGFWKHQLVVGGEAKARQAMGSFGRLTSLADLPKKSTLLRYVRSACKLNEEGVQGAREKYPPKPMPKMHPAFEAALSKNKVASTTFAAFPPSHRREYLEWIQEAKQDSTRARRITQAIEWLAAGKSRNWKYEKC